MREDRGVLGVCKDLVVGIFEGSVRDLRRHDARCDDLEERPGVVQDLPEAYYSERPKLARAVVSFSGLGALRTTCGNIHMHRRAYDVSVAADVFEILADPTRRRIVEALRGGEQAVNDIVERVDIDQSGVSRHLRILHEAGFVKVRPEGPKRLYSLQPAPFRELDDWVSKYREMWEDRLDALGDELERRRKARVNRK